MALVLLNPGINPLGQFDGYTGETLNYQGGEVCTWAAMPSPASGASDVNSDGYVAPTGLGFTVPGISRALLTSSSTGPFFLADEGINHYGTLFGAVVGGSVGQQVNGPNTYTGAVLGPHTSTGSGKVTVWDKPGLYGVTLDSVDTASDGLVLTNGSLKVGTLLTFGAGGTSKAGYLTPVGSTLADAATGGDNTKVVATLASFETNGSLVTTPYSLVAALNSPSGDVTSIKPNNFYMAVVWYGGAAGIPTLP
jgi:hypothetical protein